MTDRPPGPPPLPGRDPSDDRPPGPGYWKASDGNWYPPQQATPPPPPATAPGAPTPPPPPGPAYTPHAYAQNSYPQNSYPQNSYGPGQVYGTAPATNGFATAALVLGIISILGFWTFGIGVVFGILAVVFGILGRNRARQMSAGAGGDGQRGRATAGLVTGVIGVVAGIAFVVVVVAVVDDLEINTDPADGFCDPDRFMQDPDC